ncbi:MAG: ankyrin repeat domain-containing protein [Acidobacteria bacterium]|nr:ankyrin repeat domain-containing protein [Acidobacteriota bacterium]
MSDSEIKDEKKSFFQRVFSRHDIFEAVERGDISLCWKLVCSDPELIHKTNALGKTPLHLVAFKGNLSIVKMLISKGADLNKPDINGSTPLHWAAAGGNVEVIKEIVSFGASLHSKDKEGLIPRQIAEMRGNIDATEYLKKSAGEK